VLPAPANNNLSSPLLVGLSRGLLEVLADDLDLPSCFQLDQVPGHHPGVGDVGDRPALGLQAAVARTLGEQTDLLRPDGEADATPLEQVRGADEGGDELADCRLRGGDGGDGLRDLLDPRMRKA